MNGKNSKYDTRKKFAYPFWYSELMDMLLPIIKMAPQDKSKVPSSEDANMNFSDETIREFETRYAYVVLSNGKICLQLTCILEMWCILVLRLG